MSCLLLLLDYHPTSLYFLAALSPPFYSCWWSAISLFWEEMILYYPGCSHFPRYTDDGYSTILPNITFCGVGICLQIYTKICIPPQSIKLLALSPPFCPKEQSLACFIQLIYLWILAYPWAVFHSWASEYLQKLNLSLPALMSPHTYQLSSISSSVMERSSFLFHPHM